MFFTIIVAWNKWVFSPPPNISRLTKILGGNVVSVTIAFCSKNHQTELETDSSWQRCILLVKVGPLRSHYVYFERHNVKINYFISSLMFQTSSLLMVLYLCFQYLKRYTSKKHTCVRKGLPSTVICCVCQHLLNLNPTTRLWVKSSLKVNFYIVFYYRSF